MQRLAIHVAQIVALIIQYEIKHGSVRKRGRFIQKKAAVFDPCAQAVHPLNLRGSKENATRAADLGIMILRSLVEWLSRRVHSPQPSAGRSARKKLNREDEMNRTALL